MTTRRGASDKYLTLIGEFPLRPIRSERELDTANKLAGNLAERKLTRDEDAYLDVLSVLIEQYEDERHPIQPVPATEMLAHLIEASGQSARRVALETKVQPSTMSELLSGVRKINVTHIRKLAPYFGVEPGVFITPDSGSNPKSRARGLSKERTALL
jgi:HTH-type transcriptional regulator/antitoxin HigA